MTLHGVMALFCVISANSASFRAHCVNVHVRYLISWWVLVLSLTVRRYKAKCVRTRCLQEGMGQFEPRFQGEAVVPLPIYWHHSKGNWLRYHFAADSFYIMKLCSRLFVLYCRNCPKDDTFRYFIPILRKLGAAYNLGWWLVGKPASSSS